VELNPDVLVTHIEEIYTAQIKLRAAEKLLDDARDNYLPAVQALQ
jgi:hypothetical protein